MPAMCARLWFRNCPELIKPLPKPRGEVCKPTFVYHSDENLKEKKFTAAFLAYIFPKMKSCPLTTNL